MIHNMRYPYSTQNSSDSHTLLLIHGDSISDASPNNVPITNHNNVTINNTKGKFGNSSLYFNGSNYLTFPKAGFDYSNSDFTIEWWEQADNFNVVDRFNMSFYRNKKDMQNNRSLICPANANGQINISYTGKTPDIIWQNSGLINYVNNKWYHMALVKHGMILSLYSNGTKSSSFTLTDKIHFNQDGIQAIGARRWDMPANSTFKGYIDEFRISNIARWTGDSFELPTKRY